MSSYNSHVTSLFKHDILTAILLDEAFMLLVDKCQSQLFDPTVIRANTSQFPELFPKELENLATLAIWLPNLGDGEGTGFLRKPPSISKVLSPDLEVSSSFLSWRSKNKIVGTAIGNDWPEFKKSDYSSSIILAITQIGIHALRLELGENFWSELNISTKQDKYFNKSSKMTKEEINKIGIPSILEIRRFNDFEVMRRASFNPK